MYMLFVKDARGLSKSTKVVGQYAFILLLLSQVIVDHLKYSLSCDMSHNWRFRLPKQKRSMSSKEK